MFNHSDSPDRIRGDRNSDGSESTIVTTNNKEKNTIEKYLTWKSQNNE